MKRKSFGCLLLAEAGLLVALTVLTDIRPTVFSSLLAFPFEQIGLALRTLSLMGGAYNGLALMLLVAVSALPLIPVLAHIKDKARRWENTALAVTAILLAVVLFQVANPAARIAPDEQMLPVINAMMGGVIWSLLICWAVLRLLRLFQSGSMSQLYAYLRAFRYGLCMLFVGVIAVSCAGGFMHVFSDVQRPLDALMAFIRFAVSALPYAMDIAVTFSAMTLLDKLLEGQRAEAAQGAERLSKLCCRTLALVTASTAGLNVLQLALAKRISTVSMSVNIPFVSLVFILTALLLSRLIAENGRLSDENDSFI